MGTGVFKHINIAIRVTTYIGNYKCYLINHFLTLSGVVSKPGDAYFVPFFLPLLNF